MNLEESQRLNHYFCKHRGQTLLILGNGPSSRMFDLNRVRCPIIGLNQAWRLHPCDYYVMGDREQYAMFEREYAWKATDATGQPAKRALFTTETGPDYAVRLKSHHVNGKKRFSLNLEWDGVYLNNTVASFGFHVAVHMLGTSGWIYLLGIDCDGPAFDGKPYHRDKFIKHRETLGYIAGYLEGWRPMIRVYDLSPISKMRVFERMPFGEAFPLESQHASRDAS